MPKFNSYTSGAPILNTDLFGISRAPFTAGTFFNCTSNDISIFLTKSLTVTNTIVLTNPCPQVIRCNFTSAGHTITLPSASGATGHPAGKIIYFKIASTNTETFDILLSDGTTFISGAGGGSFAIAYSTNSNVNGTPIDIFNFLDVTLGTIATQDSDNVDITGGNITADTLTLPNAGFFINDTDASHTLGIVPGSNLTANRTFTLTTGDANRIFDISAGNVTFGSLGIANAAATTLTANGVILGNTASAFTATAAGTTGQVLTGVTASAPVFASSLTGDFTYTSATSGVTRTLTVSNTSNTASSQALYAATVAGGTAGDAMYRASVTGAGVFTWGVDNSDSDAFVISASTTLGTTNILRSNSAGQINFPLQPCFMAFVNTQQSNVTGDNTLYNLTGSFFTVVFDQSNSFLDGVFTAPITGKYQFNVTIILANLAAGHTFFELNLVTSNRTYAMTQINPGACRTSPGVVNSLGYSASVTVDMDAADTAGIALVVNNSTKTVGVYGTGTPYTIISGQLVA